MLLLGGLSSPRFQPGAWLGVWFKGSFLTWSGVWVVGVLEGKSGFYYIECKVTSTASLPRQYVVVAFDGERF